MAAIGPVTEDLFSGIATAPHQVFVGDLPPHTTEDNLRDFFSKYGNVIDCRVIRDPITQKSKCFGFVRFARNEDAKLAIAETNEKLIDGKKIRTSLAFKKEPTNPMSFEQIMCQASPYNTTIYIGGLGKNFNAEFVRGMCAMYGHVMEIRLFQDKGYAFVRYASKESAAAAILGIHNSEINCHLVRCSWGKEYRDPNYVKVSRPLPTPSMMPAQMLPTFNGLPSALNPNVQSWPNPFNAMAPTQIAANIGNYHISLPFFHPNFYM